MEALRQLVDQRFADLRRQLDDRERVQDGRHDENIDNFKDLERGQQELVNQMTRMNGTVARHDIDIRDIKARPPAITLSGLRWMITVYVGGLTTAVGLVTALFLILRAFKLLPGQ